MEKYDDDESNPDRAAEIECEMIDAAKTLMEEYGYSYEDIRGIIAGTCRR